MTLLVASGGVPSVLRRMVRSYGSAKAALGASNLSPRLRDGLRDSSLERRVLRQFRRAAQVNAHWIQPTMSTFTHPVDVALLCVRGQIPTGSSVSIVGSRRADSYGVHVSKSLSRVLSGSGVSVVSGGALGIDEEAHRAALDMGNSTVAVLGTGLCGERNSKRRRLQEDIVGNGGAVVSEFLMDSPGSKWSFPERNRIVACWGKAVVVVQAARKSGALITAKIAHQKGIPLFAVAGDVCHPNSVGTNGLIASQRAKLFQHPRDLIPVLNAPSLKHVHWAQYARSVAMNAPNAMDTSPTIDSSRVYEAILKKPGQSAEEIASQVGAIESSFAEVLFELEMDERIRVSHDNTYEVI